MTALAVQLPVGDELPSPAPLAHGLPAIYRRPDDYARDTDDSFAQRFLEALDAVLAPVLYALDSQYVYLDPKIAPEHFLDWLAGWVGLELYERWQPALRRTLIAGAVDGHRRRGTKEGVETIVAIFTNAERVTVEESGFTRVLGLGDHDDPAPSSADERGNWMQVTVAIGKQRYALDGEAESVRRLAHRVVTRVKPAHVFLRSVEVTA
jgi:phage tail-like protein